MSNGDSIIMQAWYREVCIVPNPVSTNLFYVFSVGITNINNHQGLYYSIVDISANGGLGAVVQKNVQLHNFKCNDGLTAIKHGNGRDWWLINRRWNTVNNTFYKYLITPNGVSDSITQNIGSITNHGFGRVMFSNTGNRMLYYTLAGLMELYDFDRCTGELSNLQTIYTENIQLILRNFWGACFSVNDSLLYVTSIPQQSTDTSRLYQFDLSSSNIAATADTLRETTFMETMGDLKLAPDGKIYLATSFYQNYPYNDTSYTTINTYLSTINSPDSFGSVCDFQPYSFYLGGKRTYTGLPNNPNYDLGPLLGSGCDTLTNVSQPLSIKDATLNVYYHPSWQTLFVNAQNIKGKNCLLQIFDMNGRCVFTFHDKSASDYFTHDVPLQSTANGIYLLKLTTEKETLTTKFAKQ
jgi:hypothetical protein